MPVAISSTLLPESKSYGAMLRSAFDQFSRHVGNVDLLQGETAEERAALLDGVLECLDAAEDELSTIQQEKLLRSAQFGKCFLDGMDPVPEAAEAADATAEPAVSTASAASAASAATAASAASAATATTTAPAPAAPSAEAEKAGEDAPSIVTRFQEVCHTLRVLNMLRDPSVPLNARPHA